MKETLSVSLYSDFYKNRGEMPLEKMLERIKTGFYAKEINEYRRKTRIIFNFQFSIFN
jgi:predicted Zn-dependent protease